MEDAYGTMVPPHQGTNPSINFTKIDKIAKPESTFTLEGHQVQGHENWTSKPRAPSGYHGNAGDGQETLKHNSNEKT